MTPATIVQIVFAALAVAAIGTIVGVRIAARKKRRQAADRALGRGDSTLLADPEACFEGLKCRLADKSRWRRGKGTLVLTERKLRYDEFFPTYEMEIPLKEIRAVNTGETFLGKYRGRPILTLHFNDSNGMPADVGFSVVNPGAWALEIRKRIPA